MDNLTRKDIYINIFNTFVKSLAIRFTICDDSISPQNHERKTKMSINKFSKEARRIAEEINLARLAGDVPSDELTVRLCEVLDIIDSARKELPVFSEYARSEGV